MNHPAPHYRSTNAGFSMIEVQIAIVLLLVGLLGLASATTVGMSTMETNRESARAMQTARQIMESLEQGDTPFESLFTAYYADPVDPTQNPNSIPLLSRYFDVKGLAVPKGGEAMVGKLVFPVAEGPNGPEISEAVAKRDLNGDGRIDTENHAADYLLLPVTVRVEWAGKNGTRQIELHTLLTRK